MWFSKKKPEQDLIALINVAVKEAAKKSAEKGGEAIGAQLGGLVSVTVSTALGPVMGAGLGKVVDAILKGVDMTERRLKSLISEPFTTGSRQIRYALSLPCKNEHEWNFRNEKLLFGIEKLESALTIADDAGDSEQKMFILFLLALSEGEIPGGSASALHRLNSMEELIVERSNHISEGIRGFEENTKTSFEDKIRIGKMFGGIQYIQWNDEKYIEEKRIEHQNMYDEAARPLYEKIDNYKRLALIVDEARSILSA